MFFFLHGYLPFIILSFIISVLIFSFFFLFYFKQNFNIFLVESVFNKLSLNNNSLKLVNKKVVDLFFFRHVFNFFAKAWLFDIFVAKIARFSFLLGRIFFQRSVENGLFEYILVLYPVRRLGRVGLVLSDEGLMSGRLSVYLLNILIGGIFSIVLFLIFIFITL